MARFMDTGVTYFEEDRANGAPFIIRIGGSNEFVSEIDPDCPRSSPPGNVELVEGWEHPDALKFDDMDAALKAAAQVWEIEGFHVTVEPTVS
jgi:hypothetical protein